MLILLLLVSAACVSAVTWMLCGPARRHHAVDAAGEPVLLPADDLPPATALGWPPYGRQFSTYVERGFQALDAYLSEGFATDEGGTGLS